MSHSKRHKVSEEKPSNITDLDKQLGDLDNTIATYDSSSFNNKNLFESVEELVNELQDPDSEQYLHRANTDNVPIRESNIFATIQELINTLDEQCLNLKARNREIIEWEIASSEISIFYLQKINELEARNKALINEVQQRDRIINKKNHQYQLLEYQYQELKRHNTIIELDLIHSNSQNMRLREELIALRQ
jgi:hypothetical protein